MSGVINIGKSQFTVLHRKQAQVFVFKTSPKNLIGRAGIAEIKGIKSP
jgi:hypothetical protein